MTITTSNQKVDKAKFDENFDKIFGKPKKVESGSFVMDPVTGELRTRVNSTRAPGVNAPMIMDPLKPFVSPIDKSVITSRSQREAHNKKHGVTNVGDYNDGYVERKAHERVNEGQAYLNKTRRTDIGSAIDRHSQ